jgi:hypothetical protein
MYKCFSRLLSPHFYSHNAFLFNMVRVLVGCPTYDGKAYCLHEYLAGLRSLTYPDLFFMIVDNSEKQGYHAQILRAAESAFLPGSFTIVKDKFAAHAKDRIIASRNLIREYALKENFDFFLSLEQDVIPPPDVVERLVAHDKDVVSALVWNVATKAGKSIRVPMLYEEKEAAAERIFYIDPSKVMHPGLYEISTCALACTLISRNVLSRIVFRYEKGFDDMMFCKDARKEGFSIFADTSVIPEHKVGSWTGVLK